MSGVTTMIGGGTGPGDRHRRDDLHARARGTSRRMLQALDAFPMNFGFLGKGNASLRRAAARASRGRRRSA